MSVNDKPCRKLGAMKVSVGMPVGLAWGTDRLYTLEIFVDRQSSDDIRHQIYLDGVRP